MDLKRAIDTRHSVNRFMKGKKIDYRKLIDLIDSANKSPLAGNHPSIYYIIVQEPEKIKQLAEASVQDFFQNASAVIVICSDYSFLEKSYYERGGKYGKHQAGAATENLLLRATDMGLGACWVGAFTDEIVKRTLRIPENIEVETLIPIGIEMGKAKQKSKPNLDRVLFFDEWKNMFMVRKNMIPSTKS